MANIVCICAVYYGHSRRVGMCLTHVQVYTWVQVRVWSSVCFLMCVSQYCSPLSSNCSSMLKPSVCFEIVREREKRMGHGTVCIFSYGRGWVHYSGLSLVEIYMYYLLDRLAYEYTSTVFSCNITQTSSFSQLGLLKTNNFWYSN